MGGKILFTEMIRDPTNQLTNQPECGPLAPEPLLKMGC
jgi:hypothetical protein